MEKVYNSKQTKKTKYEINAYNIITWVLSALVCLYAFIIWIFIWTGHSSASLIFAVIPACFLVSLLNKNHYCILIGEFITIGADIALILFNKTDAGMGIFIFAQIAYAIYFVLQDKNKIRNIVVSVIRPVLIGICMPIAWVVTKSNFNLTVIFAMIYFPNLVMNIIHAGLLKKWYFMIAFILFLLCDTCIGLNVILPHDIPFMKVLNKFNLTHLFYIPSQVLIAFTSHWYKWKK